MPDLRLLLCAGLISALAFSPLQPVRAQMTLLHYDSTAYVIRSGSGAGAVIFLPGLGAGSYVYDDEIRRLAPHFVTYAVDFAGLDGEPPVPPPFLDRFEQSIVHLIRDRKLTKVVIVGDHFGGQVALRVAADLPGNVAGVVAIDSLTAPSPIAAPQALQSFPNAAETKAIGAYAKEPKAKFDEDMRALADTIVSGSTEATSVATHLDKSDASTVGGTLAEYAMADVRSRLSSVSCPVALFASYTPGVPAATWKRVYAPYYAGVAHFDFVAIGPSKHLVMYDRAEAFRIALERYIFTMTGTKP